MENISVFLPFPQLEHQLFEIEPLSFSEPSLSEDYDDFLQTLVQRADEGNSGDSQQKIRAGKGASSKENNEAEKGKRGRGRPPDRKSLVEKRQEANTRERKRMRALVRAYNRVKEKLPNKKNIKSKKEIIDQAIAYIRELNDTLTSSSFLEQTIQ